MSKRLYVGNLGYDTSEATLGGLFATVGEVISVNVITDRMTGRSRGFGFVEMPDEIAQQAIAQLNGKMLDDRAITVAEARPRTEGDRGPRRGGNGSRDRRY